MAAPQNPSKDRAPKQVKLVNGDFEQPDVPRDRWDPSSNRYVQLPDATRASDKDHVPGWIAQPIDPKATPDHLIELWASGVMPGVDAASGKQYAELNARQESTLYQDLDTENAGTLYWSLMHRGRDGVDKMAVDIGPPDKPVQQAEFADDRTAWVKHTGSYTVPAGQKVTRFAFRSVSAYGGSQTNGNFLDRIEFGTPPYVVLEKTATPGGQSQVGRTLTYQVNATNYGGVAAEQFVLSDTLPDGIAYVPGSARVVKGPGAGTTVPDVATDGRTVRFYLGAGADPAHRKGGRLDTTGVKETAEGLTVEFQVRVDRAGAGGTVENQATAAYTHTVGGETKHMTSTSNAVSTPVAASVRLRLVKAADRTRVNVGETVTFVLRVSNDGPSPATGIKVTDRVPATLTFLSATASDGAYDPATGRWALDNLAVGHSATLELKVQVTRAGEFRNSARAVANETGGQDGAQTGGGATAELVLCARSLGCGTGSNQDDGDHHGGDHHGGDHHGGDHHDDNGHQGGDHQGGDHQGGNGHHGGDHQGGDHQGGDHDESGGLSGHGRPHVTHPDGEGTAGGQEAHGQDDGGLSGNTRPHSPRS
ncbi:isopeptide-forming domain-containing fimbrial protein [Actinomadura gamaensis]|uniref:Isopeptide-forming domain-containing fimbrial protein n=1 Tax=Actinomadura gamaensis TaxID=1763541 RepID=A0ABV9U0S2_9ACTN